MKKLLFSTPVLLGLIWVGMSYFSGQKIEDSYEASLAELTRSSGVIWEKAEYSAGVINSSAITAVRIPDASEDDLVVRLLHEIQHTPIGIVDGKLWSGVANVKTTLLKDESYSDEMKAIIQSFASDEPLLINTEVKFDRSSTSDIILAKASYDNDVQNVSLSESKFKVNVHGDNIIIEGTFGDLISNNTSQESVNVTGSELTADLQRVAEGIYTGTSNFTMDSFTISGPNTPVIDIKYSGVNYVSRVENNKLNSRFTYFIDDLGSPLPLNAVSLDITARGTTVDRWAEFSKVYEETINSDGDNIDIPRMVSKSLNLLEPESGADVTLRLTNDGGVADTTLNINVVPATSDYYPDGGVNTAMSLRELFQLFTAKLSINADAAAIDLTPMAAMLQSPIAQQYIVSNESTHTLNLSIEALLVTINGNSIPLEPMIPFNLDRPIEMLLETP